ncbi:MAG: hypothetical protein P8Y38_09660 [Deltaproteobacteria bacterium]
MKIILILLDGLGDRAYPELNHRTPLQAAATPNLDHLAANGSSGLFHASYPGQCLPSEIAHFLLFGYDLADFPGRGLLEAAGEGVPYEKEDVLCLAHLCGIEWRDGIAVLKRGRDDITGRKEQLSRMYRLIDRFEKEQIKIRLEQTRRNDAVLVISGFASQHISDSDPILQGRPIAQIMPRDGFSSERAERTAKVLNDYLRYCYGILRDPIRNPYRDEIPANFLVTQRCGKHRPQTPFQSLWGLRGAFIALFKLRLELLLISTWASVLILTLRFPIRNSWTYSPNCRMKSPIKESLNKSVMSLSVWTLVWTNCSKPCNTVMISC